MPVSKWRRSLIGEFFAKFGGPGLRLPLATVICRRKRGSWQKEQGTLNALARLVPNLPAVNGNHDEHMQTATILFVASPSEPPRYGEAARSPSEFSDLSALLPTLSTVCTTPPRRTCCAAHRCQLSSGAAQLSGLASTYEIRLSAPSLRTSKLSATSTEQARLHGSSARTSRATEPGCAEMRARFTADRDMRTPGGAFFCSGSELVGATELAACKRW